MFKVEWQLDSRFAGEGCSVSRNPLHETYESEAIALGMAIKLAKMGYVAYVLDTRLPEGSQVIARRQYDGAFPRHS